jgi:ABC-type polar amino acid transport system ATPase subunit
MLVVTHEAQFANDIAKRHWRVEDGTLVEITSVR